MHIEARGGRLRARAGALFAASDAARLEEVVSALGPFSSVAVDFSAVRECDDTALARLAGALASFPKGRVALHGLTVHQSRVLRYLGFEPRDLLRRAAPSR